MAAAGQPAKRKSSLTSAPVSIVGAILLSGLALGAVLSASSPQAKATAAVAPRPSAPQPETDQERARREATRSAAIANLPAQLPPLRAELDEALSLAAKAKNEQAELDALRARLEAAAGKVKVLEDAVGKGSSPELDAFKLDVDAADALAQAVDVAHAHMVLRSPKEFRAAVRTFLEVDDWAGALALCDGALAAIASAKQSRQQAAWTARFLPAERVLDSTARELTGLRERAIVGQEALRALVAKCGDAPRLSQWDGELVGLDAHVEETAHDPDSIDVEACSKPQLHEKLCWVSECNVRGKNAFGALVLRRLSFAYAQGTYVDL